MRHESTPVNGIYHRPHSSAWSTSPSTFIIHFSLQLFTLFLLAFHLSFIVSFFTSREFITILSSLLFSLLFYKNIILASRNWKRIKYFWQTRFHSGDWRSLMREKPFRKGDASGKIFFYGCYCERNSSRFYFTNVLSNCFRHHILIIVTNVIHLIECKIWKKFLNNFDIFYSYNY